MGELDVLAECAERAGLDAAYVMEFLKGSSSGTREVQKELNEYRRNYDVTGVPFFVINGKYTMSGAQPASEFLSIFQKLI